MRTADFELPVPLQPKVRPRFSGHAYTDKKYAGWMEQCKAILGEWWTLPPLQKGQLLSVHFTFRGPGTSDLDNLVGAVMDAGTGIIWVDDRVTVLKHIVAAWEQYPTAKQSILLKVIWE